MAGSEAKFGAVLGVGPVEHSVPEGRADTLAADILVGDEIFKIGDTADNGPHDNREGSDTDDAAIVVDGE